MANLYELTSALEKAPASPSRSKAVEILIRLAAPMVPHLAEEAWAAMGREGLIAYAEWPAADPALLAVFAGSGVGGGVVLDGRLRRGDHGSAGEIGHVVVRMGGE